MRPVLLVLCLLAGALQVQAQAPFSTLEFQVLTTSNVNRNLLHEYWRPGRGGTITLATPFYWGITETGATIHRYNAARDVPGFGAFWVFAGWSVDWRLKSTIAVRPGLRLGNYRMSFDGAETTFAGVSTESDLVLSGGVAISAAIGPTWGVSARADYLRVHTTPLLRLWYVSGGLAVRIPAGRRLRALLE